jgi:uncharacterized damage-inducible protein DinB
MTTLATIQLLYNYHYWRIGRILNSDEELMAQHWDQPLTPSWGSVHGLLAHMLGAEKIWLGRWKGVSVPTMMSVDEVPTFKDLRNQWAVIEHELRDFIAHCDEACLNKDLTYTNTSGKTYTLPLGALMVYVVDHATHHRGELVAMLTILGISHPDDGLLGYLIEHSTQA